MKIIAHINYTFFNLTETFIWQYISSIKDYRQYCFAKNIKNLEKLAFPKKNCFKVYIPFGRKESLFYFIFRKKNYILKLLKNRKIELIHAHFGPSGVVALFYAKALRVPLITSFYGFDISKLALKKYWLKRYQRLFREGNLFLVEGLFMKQSLVNLGCPESKIRIQRIAIDVENIGFRTRLPKNRDENVIFIFGGRFVEKKGLIYALKAFLIVREKFKNFEFKIIGDGLLKESIEAFISSHKMDNYVKLLGFLDYTQYLEEMSRGDVFVHPSVVASDGDSEGGAPTSILEAQAMGMPIISTFHADIPNIVLPQISAFLSQEKDIDGLAANICYLLNNQDIWANAGIRGRQFVSQFHNIKKEKLNLQDKYEILISNGTI